MLLRPGFRHTLWATVLLLAAVPATGQVGHPSGARGGALIPSAHTLTRGTVSLGSYANFTRDGITNFVFGMGSGALGITDWLQIYGSESLYFSGTGDTYFDYDGYFEGWAVGPIGLTLRLPRPRSEPFQLALHLFATPGMGDNPATGHNHPYARDTMDIGIALAQNVRVRNVDFRMVEGGVLAEDTPTNIPNHLMLGGGFTWWLTRSFGLEAEVLSRLELESPYNIGEDYLAASGGAVWGPFKWLNLRGGYYLGFSSDRTDGSFDRAEEWAAYGSLEILLWNKQEYADRDRPRRPMRPEPEAEPAQPVVEPGEPERPVARPMEGDRDGDGVPDDLDLEPDTPAGAVVDASGRSIDADGDSDGVPDGLDMEPMTLPGAVVDPSGVAVDSDADGVPDGLDLEPNTIPGVPVDSQGVGLHGLEADLITKGLLTLNAVYFDYNATTIKPESYATLREVGLILDKYSELKIEVGGHSDNTGSVAYNMGLSLARAESVLNWLLENVPELSLDQFTIFGYGPNQPVASNDSPEGRTLNRRVEFKVLNTFELEKYRRPPPE